MNTEKPKKTSPHGICCYPACVCRLKTFLSVMPVLFPDPFLLRLTFRSVLSGRVRKRHTRIPGIRLDRLMKLSRFIEREKKKNGSASCPLTNGMFQKGKYRVGKKIFETLFDIRCLPCRLKL